MAEIILDKVSKTYPGGSKAVSSVSLAVADQEFVVLVGPSGCGKSTTLRMVAGLEDVTQGEIRIGGRLVNTVPATDRNIAMVFQNYALYPHMSVRKNLAFGLLRRRRYRALLPWLLSSNYRYESSRELAQIAETVLETARILGLKDFLDRRPRELSGGQRQRVALGRAMVRKPSAFLFDEPLSNLDAKLRSEMRTEIKALQRRFHATTLYVTHDQEEAMTLADRMVVMKDGVIQQNGSPSEVYSQPANRFVAGFVGTPAMNFLEGQVSRKSGLLWFDDGAHRLQIPHARSPELESQEGNRIALGVRAEGLRLATGEDRGNRVRGKVTVREDLGDRVDLLLRTAHRTELVWRTSPEVPIREGEEIEVEVDMARVHFFEPGDTGRRLRAPQG